MNSEDQELQVSLQASQRQVDAQVPDFESVFAAAERQSRDRRRIRFAGLAAAGALIAFAVALLPMQEDEFIYVDVEELTATTQWSAPSDSLLPKHQFDMYRELPGMFESTDMSTNTDEGALL